MRILILAPGLPHEQSYSGMQIVFQRMSRLIERGHQVGLACFIDSQRERTLVDRLPSGLYEVETLREPGLNSFFPASLKLGRMSAVSSFMRYYSRGMKRLVGEMVARSGYDVVIAEYTAMGQMFQHNPWLPAVRQIISCHDSPTLSSRKFMEVMGPSLIWGKQWLEYRHMRHLEFKLYRQADRVLTLTNEERHALMEEDPSVPIRTVFPGLRSETFQPLPNLPKEHSIIITGRFSSDQSHYGALWFLRNVWPLLRQRDPLVTLYLVGRDPSPAMRHHAMRDKRIFITGMVDDLRPYLAKSKVYVCPLLSGSGLRGKILEAMAMELPVVTTLTGAEGIPIRPGNNGLIADTPDIMASYIHMLLHDAAKCRSMGREARATVESQFTWKQSLDALEHVLHDVVAKRSYHLLG